MTDQTIILTGVTGFLGQCILYKLFDSGYTNVFLHIRNKKNKTSLERLNYVLSNKLFDSEFNDIYMTLDLYKLYQMPIHIDSLKYNSYHFFKLK